MRDRSLPNFIDPMLAKAGEPFDSDEGLGVRIGPGLELLLRVSD